MYLNICQTLIDFLGHTPHCVFLSHFLLSACFLSIEFVSCFSGASSLIWHLSPSPLFILSYTQPAVSGSWDRDEKSGWGQCHLTLPPSVPVVRLTWHRVAAGETKVQTERGEIRFLYLSDSFLSIVTWIVKGLTENNPFQMVISPYLDSGKTLKCNPFLTGYC